MKKLELFICFCSLFLISYVVVSAKDSNYVLKDEVIIIDPGHGRYSYAKTINRHVKAR